MEGLPRKKRKAYPKPRKVRSDAERKTFGKKALDESEKIIEDFSKWKSKYGDKIDPKLIFKIEANSPINENDLGRMGLKILGVDYKDAVVVFADDEHLTAFKRMIEEYANEIPPDQENAKHAFIHAFEDIRKIAPGEKIGVRLRKEPLKDEDIAILDIELWHLGREYREQMLSWKDGIDRILKENGGEVTDFYLGRALFIIRAKVPSTLLYDILNLPQVARVDRPPKTTLDLAKIKGISLDEIGEIPSPEDDAPGILIVDSGITSGHPLLKSAIGDAQSYLDGKSPVDENSHGTAVAGVALYGDLREYIKEKKFNPELWIYSARVCDENGEYDKEKLPETQLDEAIKYFVEHYENIRVVNLSIGDPEKIYHPEDYQYRLAAVIDELALEYGDNNILFVVSAGNYEDSRTGVEYLDEETASRYPAYLLDDPNAKVIDPATSALALTVGSLSLEQGSANRWFASPLAGFEEFPSPFTRTGPGVNGMIKPDLVEFGGDLTSEKGSGIVTDPSIGVITTEKNFLTEGLFRVEDGTSFSAAKVSHLAAKLWRELPDATSNLIKALLVASAKIPDIRPPPLDSIDLKGSAKEDQSKLLNIYGYGHPSLDRAFSIQNRVLLIDEREINLDDIVIYEIPVPVEFYRGSGRRTISITLAFDPPTRMTRKQYLGVTMEFHLFRGVDVEQIKQRYAKMETFDTEEEGVPPLLRSNEISLVPGVTLAKKGTVQKRMWLIDRTPDYIDESLKLVVICSGKWMIDEEYKQRYAVVVTMEQRDMIELYNKIKERLRIPERVRIRPLG
ncbi:MAG: subtilase family protein [Candidatus Syntrophoarchaeum caldarius]|uniref:Subtilase family protein n=1 Tax=Candidatus Syntropharchaeum caldarium TaxID=1838285 RepID=A0A1F2P7Y3_9EURY|nr:MAG: subtilase family protein [Candidatus Syntrophoarchaeum caldarius]